MQTRSVLFSAFAFFFFFSACSGATGASDGTGGTGQLTVTSSRPTAGSSVGAAYSVSATFTTSAPACATMTIGACTVNPCYGSNQPAGDGSEVLGNAGAVTLVGAGMTSLGLEPQNDGTYASESVTGELPWPMGGDSVTFQWAHFPGVPGSGGDDLTLATPPYIALTAGSTFDVLGNVITRSDDLTVSWTSDTPPSSLDEVSVGIDSGAMQTYCIYSAAAGAGVVPAAVLGYLPAGNGTYNVISKEHAWENIKGGSGAWVMNFNVNALARTSYGLASGHITIQ